MDIIKIIKDVGEVARKADNIELYKTILDLQKEALDLLEENRNLRDEIKELKENSTLHENLIPHSSVYYLKKGDTEDGPFCTGCWDNRNKLIRLHSLYVKEDRIATECPVCKKFVHSDVRNS